MLHYVLHTPDCPVQNIIKLMKYFHFNNVNHSLRVCVKFRIKGITIKFLYKRITFGSTGKSIRTTTTTTTLTWHNFIIVH